MNEIVVKLTYAELMTAASVGVMRRVQGIKLGRKTPERHLAGFMWGCDIEGAAGEFAVAKYLNRFWSGAIGDLEADDAGSYQVRTAIDRPDGCLILKEWDHSNRIYILVTSDTPSYTLRGWIWGHDAKRAEFLRRTERSGERYFVPQSALHPINTLGLQAAA